jgi:hypothetical protein
MCPFLVRRCPRNAKAINIEAEQNEPSFDLRLPMFSPWIEY